MKHLSKYLNIQNKSLNINKASNKKVNCNYNNNYYGDQVCVMKTNCNYANNYYGDQVCLTN